MTGPAPPHPAMRAILAATDFTPRSAQVVARAAGLARALRARLVVAHASAGPARRGRIAQPVRPLLSRLGLAGRAMTEQNAEARLATLRRAMPPGSETRLLTGPPEEALANLAAEIGAELLVLGLHRERRVLDVLRLTTMERIVLAAEVPVLIAHLPAERPYARVLALTDFSPGSAAALRMAARIAPGARFHAVHALQLPLLATVAGGEAAADEALVKAELLRAGFLTLPGLPELAEPPELVPGGVHEVLAFRRDELQAELVCIGTHSGRDRAVLGNYARDLMRAPPSDLLVAKPG